MSDKKNEVISNRTAMRVFSIRKAAKERECQLCGSEINKNQLYSYMGLKTSGDRYPRTFVWCLECVAANVKCLTFQLP